MTKIFFQTGEEFYTRRANRSDTLNFDTGLEVGLYNQSVDQLVDDSVPADINTEPGGSAYTRQTPSLDSSAISLELNTSGNFQFTVSEQLFDLSDSTSTDEIDAFFVSVFFESSVAGDSSISENLYFAANLDQAYPLEFLDEFRLSQFGVAIN